MSTTTEDEIVTRPKKRKKVRFRGDDAPPKKASSRPVIEEGPKGAVSFRSIHVDPTKIPIHVQQRTKRYWCGAFVDAPFQTKHAFGVAFSKWSGIIEADPESGEPILDRAHPGCVVSLTDDQVEGVRAAVAAKVVRTVGRQEDRSGNYRCDTYNVSSPHYRRTEKDVPLGRFIYMVEVGEMMPPDWRASRPPAMC